MIKFLFFLFAKRSILFQVAGVAATLLILAATDQLAASSETAFILLAVLAVVNAKARSFMLDYAPFILLLLTYDTLRGYADNFGANDIHITDLIQYERAVFGGALPGYEVQQALWGQFYTPVLDVIANALYLIHFLTPVLMAILLWRYRRAEYWAYIIGLVALSYAAFATYLTFPAAPPWWATHYGYLRSTPITLEHFVISAERVRSSANPVAAMPSLHVAYPTYIALVCVAVWGKRALPMLLLPAAVWSATLYLGHHYVIDGLAGVGYAVFFFGTVFWWCRKHEVALDKLVRRAVSLPALFHR